MKNATPPRLAAWLLLRISGPLNGPSIVGDYEEIYLDMETKSGMRTARSWYWSQVLKSLPMFTTNVVFGGASMFKNYLKLAYRNIFRHKRYAFLNILGLAVGLAACLLIASYVIHELSFDKMHPSKDRIYRINGLIPFGGEVLHNAVVGAPLGPAVEESIPEIEESVRILRRHDVPVRVEDKDFKEKKVFFAEQDILQVFSIPLVRGNPRSALEAPFSVIIDESLARKYFGQEDPLGKSIRMTLQKTFDFQISGVMRNMPSNTVLRIPLIASFATLNQTHGEALKKWESWGNITTFIRLIPAADVKTVDTKITALARSYLSEKEKDASYYLQPLRRIYINNADHGMNNDLDNSGSLTRLYIFSAVALLILLIAAINFINLSTAKIAGRLKEVGVRKTCGAMRSHLVKQFLIESLLLTTLAMAVGLILFSLFKPQLDIYLGKTLNLDVLMTPWILPSIVAMILVVGFLAGSYPAFFLSRFQAAVIFRSGVPRSPLKSGLRRILVGMQFFIAGALIVCTLIVFKQVRYSETIDLGFNKDNLIILRIQDASRLKNSNIIKNLILSRTGALAAASIEKFPSAQNRSISNIRIEGQTEDESKLAQSLEADADFVPVMGLKLAAGRNFEEGRIGDRETVLINKTAAESLGLKDPVGSFLYRGDKAFQIIGMLEDWSTNSIHSRIYPIVLFHSDESAAELILRLPLEGNKDVISRIKEVISEIAPEQIFNFTYISDLHLRSYDEERRLASLLISFCLLTVFVACLGIFGLAAYSTEQRTKEIGIRKVLGSSVSKIILLFTGSYARWVFVANLFAWPAAYFIVNKWLQSFAFRTKIGFGPFLVAGLITLSVALFSVIYQTLKAALAAPVDSLRYE
jgi:putative ABC transport system permease protein